MLKMGLELLNTIPFWGEKKFFKKLHFFLDFA